MIRSKLSLDYIRNDSIAYLLLGNKAKIQNRSHSLDHHNYLYIGSYKKLTFSLDSWGISFGKKFDTLVCLTFQMDKLVQTFSDPLSVYSNRFNNLIYHETQIKFMPK
jgi:hypothetical protein